MLVWCGFALSCVLARTVQLLLYKDQIWNSLGSEVPNICAPNGRICGDAYIQLNDVKAYQSCVSEVPTGKILYCDARALREQIAVWHLALAARLTKKEVFCVRQHI